MSDPVAPTPPDPNRPRAVVVSAGTGESIVIGDVTHLFRLVGAQTEGRAAIEEFRLAPGAVGARPHVHDGHDEYFYVLSGELTVHDGNGEVVLGPGGLAAAGRGAPHGYRNAGAVEAVGLCIFTPAGYENYFRDVHAAVAGGAVLDESLLTELRARYGTTPYPPR